MPLPADRLFHLLAVQPTDQEGVYRGQAGHEQHVRAFGGQLLGQAMAAFTMQAPRERRLHSFHGYFLRPAKVDRPVDYAVQLLREGRSFTHLDLEATQEEKVILTASASFHHQEDGFTHSEPLPDLPPPDQAEPFEVRYAGREAPDDMGRWFDRVAPFEIRYPGPSAFDAGDAQPSAFWVRLRQPPKEPGVLSPALSAALLGFLSDLAVLDPILMAHDVRWTDAPVIGASLDHSLWIHRPFDVTRWLLFHHTSPASHGGRGLSLGRIFQDGVVVASVAQEALLRPPGQRRG